MPIVDSASDLDWEKSGALIPTIVQDAASGQVLMLAYMNQEALTRTLEGGQVTFWSRSRRELWRKGVSSGNGLRLVELRYDCDRDALLALVSPSGPACHKGTRSCFAEDGDTCALEFLGVLERLIRQRKRDLPPSSYTARLFRAGASRIAQKFGEEAVEVMVAALQSPARLPEESADLIYHWLVLLANYNVDLREVIQELSKRHQ